MNDLLNYLIKSIVTNPDAVEIEAGQEYEGFTPYTITVDPEDMGIAIGKSGKTIRAIRTLARLRGVVTGKKVRIELSHDNDRTATA